MVSETVTITFYKIQKCGYYRYGVVSPAFGGCDELLTDLALWAEGKNSNRQRHMKQMMRFYLLIFWI